MAHAVTSALLTHLVDVRHHVGVRIHLLLLLERQLVEEACGQTRKEAKVLAQILQLASALSIHRGQCVDLAI